MITYNFIIQSFACVLGLINYYYYSKLVPQLHNTYSTPNQTSDRSKSELLGSFVLTILTVYLVRFIIAWCGPNWWVQEAKMENRLVD